MKRAAVALFVLATSLTGCLEGAESVTGPITSAEPVRFVAIGDAGTGEEGQARVAATIKDICDARGCDFAITMGDNIYDSGATSPFDPQFDSKFEVPYADLDFPFFLTIGNHDNGYPTNTDAIGDNQVAYHYRDMRASDKWNMPSRWYAHEHGNAAFLALDTTITFDDPAPFTHDASGVAQQAWVAEQLALDVPGWRFAYGHHPYHSNGQHGDADPGLAAWFEETICGKVDILFSGHDHDMQWLAPTEGCDTHLIVSGAAGKVRILEEGPNEAYFAVGSTLGFLWAQVVGDTFTGQFYDVDGDLLFEKTIERSIV